MRKLKNTISIIMLILSFIYVLSISSIEIKYVYYLSIFLLCLIKMIGFFILPISRYIKVSNFYNYLSIYFASAGFLSFVSLFYMSINRQWSMDNIIISNFFANTIELLGMCFALRAKEKDQREIFSNVFILSTISIGITLLSLRPSAIKIIADYIIGNYDILKGLYTIAYIVIGVYFLKLCSKRNIIIMDCLTKYIGSRIIFYILSIILPEPPFESGLKIIAILVSCYYIGKIMYYVIILKSNESLYKNLKENNNNLNLAIGELEKSHKLIKDEYEHTGNIINTLPEGIAIFEDGKLVFINEKIKELFGITNANEILGKEIHDLVKKEFLEKLEAQINDLNERDISRQEEYIFKLDSREFIGEYTSTKIKKGNVSLVVSVLSDITQKREIENLNKLLEITERENELKSELLTNISHEFKTPVNVIYTALQMQSVYWEQNNMEQMMKFNFTMKQNCFRLIRLINNFIDISRFESNGKIDVNLKVVNVVPLVENIVQSCIDYITDHGVSIIFDTETEELYGEFDTEMMDRIILNLLSNGIKYNKDNGSIFVDILEDEEFIIIKIKDTGIGISEKNLKKLFNRFERVDKSLCRKREGSGIGLSIVKSLVEFQHGYISVSSEINVGTTFILTFPKVKDYVPSLEEGSKGMGDLLNKVSMELSDII